ncbi:MAG TPA: nitroreductase, partial [Bacteroidales bacterium]|nr:nitroreductase [Bacteroidales bacterium]
MSIPTSRTKEPGKIIIDTDKCIGCGLCVKVCKDFSLEIVDNKVRQKSESCFGCIACGHCMAICPNGAIEISGRT